QNKNLQTYLIANQSDFILLCKQIVSSYFEKSISRILDITPSNDNTEILAEIDTSKWTDVVLFRFHRTSSIVGELYVRDFHEKIRDTKAGRGICFTAGTFSEESRKFIDGRPIDLIEREELKKFLSNIKVSAPEGI
ncbi:MAG: restriction endonuclease, partial [Spirochaetaceae bacterium]|nr:restriction endonuclease [Spirochaetaceae bacterium]